MKTLDYSWMWRDYVQPELILNIDAVEKIQIITNSSNFIDIDNDGTPKMQLDLQFLHLLLKFLSQ